MEGVILGSGGWFPTSKRQTCSALLREGSDVLVIDAGTGIQRILERPDLVEGAENVDIVLTHFHLDHVVGLSCVPALPLSRPPVVWGPGELLVGVPTRSILVRLLDRPLFAAPFDSMARDVREISGEELALGSFALTVRVQERHSDPTLAFRVGDALTYCTDTAPDPGNVTFAEGSHVLLHEAWYAHDHDDIHSAGGDAGRIAREAGVQHLVLIHVNPLNDSDEALAASARAEFPGAQVGMDLATIPLP
jgi:ribonuclease BN (tRNA processing enzyme)